MLCAIHPGSQVAESLAALKITIADLHQHLEQLRFHTNVLFHDVSDALTAMHLHARLLEEAFEQSRMGCLPEVEKFLAAIKSAAAHLQGLINPSR